MNSCVESRGTSNWLCSPNAVVVPPIGASLHIQPMGISSEYSFEEVYRLQKRLNSGGYGTVFITKYLGNSCGKKDCNTSCKKKRITFNNNKVCTDDIYDSVYATKVLNRVSKEQDSVVRNEVSILRELRNAPGVIKLLDFYESPEKMYIVQTCAMGGDMSDLLAYKHLYTEYDVSRVAKVILTAIKHMHDRNIVHRDLKPESFVDGQER